MDLIGQKVKHKRFGVGTVVERDDAGCIKVEFADKTSLFQYPLAFDQFLEVVDESIREDVLSDLREKK